MKRRKGFIAILIIVLVAIGVSGYCYQSSRTPEYALDQLMEGVQERDMKKSAALCGPYFHCDDKL